MSGRFRLVAGALRALVVLVIISALVLVIVASREGDVGPDEFTEHPPMVEAGLTAISGRIWVSGGLRVDRSGNPAAGRHVVAAYRVDGAPSGPAIPIELTAGQWLADSRVVPGPETLFLVGRVCQVPGPHRAPRGAYAAQCRSGSLAAWALSGGGATPVALQGAARTSEPVGRIGVLGVSAGVVSVVETIPGDSSSVDAGRVQIVRIDLRTGDSRALGVPAGVPAVEAVCQSRDQYAALTTDPSPGVQAQLLVRSAGGSTWTRRATIDLADKSGGSLTCLSDRVVVLGAATPYRWAVVALADGRVVAGPGPVPGSDGTRYRPRIAVGPNDRSVVAVASSDDLRTLWYLEHGGELKRIEDEVQAEGADVEPATVSSRVYDLSGFDPNGRRTGRPGRAKLIH